MQYEQPEYEEPIRLDLANTCVWRGEARMELRPKDFMVLRTLVKHPGQLVSKDNLLAAGWPDTFVGEAVLKNSIRRLRQALGDSARQSRFIETVHRQGYRLRQSLPFVELLPSQSDTLDAFQLTPRNDKLDTFVGREAELTRLHTGLINAYQGTRQLIFVTGEVGVGKTSLVDHFVSAVHESVILLHGQCVERYGPGDAYLPVLEALGQAARGPLGTCFIALLRQYAPTWLSHFPWLLTDAELQALTKPTTGDKKEHMLSELVEALCAFTVEFPVVFVLEDLHWSDYATLDLITLLTQRRLSARLLVLGTFRPEDVLTYRHPLGHVLPTLRRHLHVEEISLTGLTENEVATYVSAFDAAHEPPANLSHLLYQHTEGNPLFLVILIEHLVERGAFLSQNGNPVALSTHWEKILEDVPEALSEMILQRQVLCDPDERRVLTAGSVAGMTFSAETVAAALGEELVRTEAQCERLAQRRLFLTSDCDERWPDGTVATRYRFRHALYQQALYEQVPAAQRSELHWRIGRREEAGYGERVDEIAARLALHFEHGQDSEQAVTYHRLATTTTLRHYAYNEAMLHARRGLALLLTSQKTLERDRQELELLMNLDRALVFIKGDSDREVCEICTRACELSEQLGDVERHFQILHRLATYHRIRGALQQASEIEAQVLLLAQTQQDTMALFLAHKSLGSNAYYRGEFTIAHTHFMQAIALYDSQPHHYHSKLEAGERNLGISCYAFTALTLWSLGYLDQARQSMSHAISLAEAQEHPFSLAWVLHNGAKLYQGYRECQTVHKFSTKVIALSTENSFTSRVLQGQIMQSWATLAHGQGSGAVHQIQQGIQSFRTTGGGVSIPYFLALLAEAHEYQGQPTEGLVVVDEALREVESTGACFYQAELYRRKGNLLLLSGSRHRVQGIEYKAQEAERSFLEGLAIARRQQAKSLELRAAISLARIWQSQDKRQDAYDLLAPVYKWFTEGFDTIDLQDAKTLLSELKAGLNIRC